MQAGMVVCPTCERWVQQVYKIPERYKSDYWYPLLGRNENYCCEYCMSERAMSKRRKDNFERTRECRYCKKRFPKEVVIEKASKYTCPSCASERERKQEQRQEQLRVYRQNTRTEKLGLAHDLTLAEWLDVVAQNDNKCHYCGNEWDCMDHVIPVSRGGGTTKDNVVPACHLCNIRKSDYEILDGAIARPVHQGDYVACPTM